VSKWKVVITDSGYRHYDIEREVLAAAGAELAVKQCTSEDDVVAFARDADGVRSVTGTWFGTPVSITR
jgi:hypothetical protein